MASEPDCLSVASEAVLANRPFSAVTLDTMVTTPSHEGHKNFDQIEDLCLKRVKKMCLLMSNTMSLTMPVLT